MTGDTPSEYFMTYPALSLVDSGGLALYIEAVGVFYSTSQQACRLYFTIYIYIYIYTIQIKRTELAGRCWRSRDELISDVLPWTPAYGRAKAGRPARTYIQQLCEDTGCSPEDLPEEMNDREKWRGRVSDIRAIGTT